MSQLDSYSLMIVTKYFNTIEDFINVEFVNKKFRFNLDKFHFNPIRLTKKTLKYFSHIETLNVWSKDDEHFGNNVICTIDLSSNFTIKSADIPQIKIRHLEFSQNTTNTIFSDKDATEELTNTAEKVEKKEEVEQSKNSNQHKNNSDGKYLQIQNFECEKKTIFKSHFPAQKSRKSPHLNEFQNLQFTSNEHTNATQNIQNIEKTDRQRFFCVIFWYPVSYSTTRKYTNENYIFKSVVYTSDNKKVYGSTIPTNVTILGKECFAKSPNTSLVVPDRVYFLSEFCFLDCNNLREIVLPKSLSFISKSAFYNCTSLTEITVPPRVSSISDYTFYSCESLQIFTVPEQVTSIGNYAFSCCYN
ncbi:leucine rich repeat containing protein BspA family protein, partial [Entamoeba invadens IP1]